MDFAARSGIGASAKLRWRLAATDWCALSRNARPRTQSAVIVASAARAPAARTAAESAAVS
jgi:hypothetical protein